ncbi:MAG: RNA polymerase sigma factor [Chthonomonadales bacterium]|nr:RNA polymerase sigma factor [Chthonomonadales bacterium]
MRDLRLVRSVLSGDHERAERWVTQEYPRIYRMLRYLTGDRETAEDLTQQAFVQAWQALPTFRGEARLDTWLHRIAYHQYTHWLRDRRTTEPLSAASGVADTRNASGLTTILVQRALDSLPHELREAFLLFYARQMSVKEIAGVLEIPVGTVKSRLFAARRAMREKLTDEPEGSVPSAAADAEATVEAIR